MFLLFHSQFLGIHSRVQLPRGQLLQKTLKVLKGTEKSSAVPEKVEGAIELSF